MKKQNNRYRSGNNNNGYTLNYKFDSVSIAGKISGTALDLIRRYNDLAKEAQSSGNYVEMEVYRQYAEHYRKIVTEINERRQIRQDSNNNRNVEQEAQNNQDENNEVSDDNKTETTENVPSSNGYVETLPANESPVKSFEVVEICENKEEDNIKETPKPKRVYKRRVSTSKTVEA
ncbi:MAG: DUF4167 domain-containing protein [Alphaproteobacteria bacterium]|nr:DUF4167 domain-containing protein [Alphaproteobacteria bacterium]